MSTKKVEIILPVPSIEATIAWYQRVLGWNGNCDTYDGEGRCQFGSVFDGDADQVMASALPFVRFNCIACDQNEWVRFCGGPAALPKLLPLPQIVITLN